VWSQDLPDIFSSSHGLTDSGVAGHAFGLRGVDLGFPLCDGALSGPGCRGAGDGKPAAGSHGTNGGGDAGPWAAEGPGGYSDEPRYGSTRSGREIAGAGAFLRIRAYWAAFVPAASRRA
jgi:hypothetical protein